MCEQVWRFCLTIVRHQVDKESVLWFYVPYANPEYTERVVPDSNTMSTSQNIDEYSVNATGVETTLVKKKMVPLKRRNDL